MQDRRRDDDREEGHGGAKNILRLALSPLPGAQRPAPPFGERDFEKTFGLVERAAEMIRASERRIQALEAGLQAAAEETEKAMSLLQAAKGRATAAEVRAEEAEMRAREAETRAREAEEWLRRLHGVIRESFPARETAEAAGRPESRSA